MAENRWTKKRGEIDMDKPPTAAGTAFAIVFFLGMAGLDVWLLMQPTTKFDKWITWLFVFGLFFMPSWAWTSWTGFRSGKTDREIDDQMGSSMFKLLMAPILLTLAGLACWALFAVIGWFATIPLWAAVIILLLIFKK